ncbi:MAG: type II toxin-antitoxin system VapC family toxin [Bifidobacteriaceae bacterium]|nr:type II toxin-antitoxin system VapC family toxin [Bifidobacteriaceae bacterium]
MSLLVVDASAVLTVILAADADRIAERMAGADLAAPHLAPFEVANVVRRRWSAGVLSLGQAELALDGFGLLVIDLWPFAAVADRVWALRGQLSSYDAAYIALAELLDAPLLTADARLARAAAAAGSAARVETA